MSADSTRRQLDELDALLQRMLALPVTPPDEESSLAEEPREPSWTEDIAEPPTPTPPPAAFRVAVPPVALLDPPPPPAPADVPPQLPRPRRRALWLRPLLWSNRSFDRCTDGLGAPGRWLRSRGGRAVLGLVGLVCLAAAVAVVVADWAGWIW